MTDRHSGYVVTLAEDIRSDDAEAILHAIRMVKGVLTVKPIVSDYTQSMAEDRARHELEMRLYRALREPLPKGGG